MMSYIPCLYIHSSTHYLAFGLSGSPSSISMFRADPVVAWVNETGGYAVDYHLSGYFQVSIMVILSVQIYHRSLTLYSVVEAEGHVLMNWTSEGVRMMSLSSQAGGRMECSVSCSNAATHQVCKS